MRPTLPNLLTVSRILVIPVVVGLFYVPGPAAQWTTAGLFVLAAITDFLDGWLARRTGQVSAFGRFLDPIADKLLVAAVLLMLVGMDRLSEPAVLPALVILCREILVSGLREHLAELNVSVPVSKLAKWKTALQMVALVLLLVGSAGGPWVPTAGEVALWAAALLTLITGWDYTRAGLRHINAADRAGD